MGKKVTIVDIAKESGYSVTTVSRVLNNRQDVSPAAKNKIMEIVKAHNFVPNTNAKRLKQNISRNIYVLVKGNSNMLFANIIEEIQCVVDRTDYSLSITYLDEDDNISSQTARICRERKPLGIIFLGGSRDDFQGELQTPEVPCVIVTTSADGWDIDSLSSVSIDDEKAGETIVDYLIENGHTKIAEIGANLELSQTAILRHNGYIKSLKKHGITPDDRYYEKARFSFDSAYRAMQRLLEKDIEITAVYAISDVMAIGAVRAILDKGLKVPDDISITGFDGSTLAQYYNPKIVSIRQPHKDMAARSVEMLFNMIDLHKEASHEIIPFELTDGESVYRYTSGGTAHGTE